MPRTTTHDTLLRCAAVAAGLVVTFAPTPATTRERGAATAPCTACAASTACASRNRLSAVFAPGTPQDYVDRMLDRMPHAPPVVGFQAGDFSRWGVTATDGFFLGQGDPTTLTWAIVPDGTPIGGGLGEPSAPSNLRAALDAVYGGESGWRPVIELVFQRYGELTGITYVEETADDGRRLSSAAGVLGVRADIRIGGHFIDGDFGVLAYNSFPNDGDMVIDTADAFFNSTSSNSRRLRNVIAHEHGHGLGLSHVCPGSGIKLMEPRVSTGIDGPQHDDIRGVQRLYGDAREPNDTTGTATDLGTAGSALIRVTDVSIDDDEDTDWYALDVGDGASADITLSPVGRVYDEGAEIDGGCNGALTTRLDTRDDADLVLELRAPSGVVIATAGSAPGGESERLTDVLLTEGAGTYFVGVRNSGENAVQLYELELRFPIRGAKPVATDDMAVTWQALPVTTAILDNDGGLEDTPIRLRLVNRPANGRVRFVDQAAVYVPDRGFAGDDAYTYEVRDRQRQRATATVSITVTASERAGLSRVDTDADGYPDELETALGTLPGDPGSHPGEDLTAADPAELDVSRLSIRLNARTAGRDSLSLRGTLPVPDGFEPEGQDVVVSVGGVTRTFTLDARGRAGARRQDAFALRLVRRRGQILPGDSRFTLTLPRTILLPDLADEGLDTARTARREPREVTVFVLFGGRTYAQTLPLTYSARRDRSGRASRAR